MQEVQTTKITPSNSWIDLDFKEIWAHRELLYFLTWRDVKIRYKQTAIGVLWVILQPVLTTAIFTVLFSGFARFDAGETPYPAFALSGLVLWFFINTSINSSSNSLIGNQNLVTKVYFPRLIMPAASTLAGAVDLILNLLLLLILIAFYGIKPTLQMFLLPVFLVMAILLTLSLGIFFSALNVRFRDVKFALPFALQIWLFISPIFYPADILSGSRQIFLAVNPLTGILNGFRSSLFGTSFDWLSIGISTAWTIVLLIVSTIVFRRMEEDFADVI